MATQAATAASLIHLVMHMKAEVSLTLHLSLTEAVISAVGVLAVVAPAEPGLPTPLLQIAEEVQAVAGAEVQVAVGVAEAAAAVNKVAQH